MNEYEGSMEKYLQLTNSLNFSQTSWGFSSMSNGIVENQEIALITEFSNTIKEFSFSRNQQAQLQNRMRQFIRLRGRNQEQSSKKPIDSSMDDHNQEIDKIKEIGFINNSPDTRFVNHKQWFRMLKRRIKKQIDSYKRNIDHFKIAHQSSQRKTYIYESRHIHAQVRPRGKDGRFLATRPIQQRQRQKKKRGRKPKSQSKVSHTIRRPQAPL